MPNPTISKMQSDIEAFRARKFGTSTPTTPATNPAPVSSSAPAPVQESGISADLADYRSKKSAGTLQKKEIPKDPGMLASFAKGIFSAPATIVARPFQAAAAIAGADNAQIDEFTKKIPLVGGLIAPTPNNAGDVVKDVGRAAQTVALGTGAPIAGGALFGAGASLEQGNDLLSVETAFNAALGGVGGKVLQVVGKPLLNAAGKVVGVITPQTLKDVAAKGATAMQEFARTHQIAGGVAGPVSEKIAGSLQKVDDVIEGGVGRVFSGAKNVAQSQYPNASVTKHYVGKNEQDIIRPTTVNEPKYAKATRVYNDAKGRGIDLEKAATERGIQHDKIADGGKYNTLDHVENIREGNYQISDDIIRPAIKAAAPGVRRVPVSEVRAEMVKRINDIPANQITAEDRATMLRQVVRRYADDGAAAKAYKDGYDLENIHDARIISQKNGGYKVGQSSSDALKAQLSREEGRVFGDIFDNVVPEEMGMKAVRKELEKNFILADYLESLHSKAVPAGITKKAVRLFGRAVTATVGGKVGGFPGSILGAQYGDMLFSSFQALPNPIKMQVLTKAFENRAQSPIFDALRKYLGEQETARLLRKALPAPGGSNYKEADPTFFTTPGGKTTPIKGEAYDVAAVETGKARTPGTDRRLSSYLKKVDLAQQDPVYTPDSELPVIKTGNKPRKPKNLSDIL